MGSRKVTIRFVDFFVYSAIAVSSAVLLLHFYTAGKNVVVYLTFLMIGIISFLGTVITDKNISIKRTLNIFSYIFFFLAPWQQYSQDAVIWQGNGFRIQFNDAHYLKANIVIIVSLLVFNSTYSYFASRQRQLGKKISARKMEYRPILRRSYRWILLGISIISVAFLAITGNLFGSGLIIGSTAVNSQIWNMLRFFPVCALIVYGIAYADKKAMIKNTEFKILILIFVINFYPLSGALARFLLMGAYVVLLALWMSERKNKSWYFLLFYIGFVLFFSVMRLISTLSNLRNIGINFNHPDFDAYQMLMTVICYTDATGIVFGKNVLSALAFLLPRSIWSGKLNATGGLAISYFGSWFKNVSSPLFSELYFAFGWGGVIFGNAILAYVINRIDGWNKSASIMKRGAFCIVAGMTIYLCRGALLAATAFTLGLLLALWLISRITKIQIVEVTSEDNASNI